MMFDRPKPKNWRDINQMGIERRTCVDCASTFEIHHQIDEQRCLKCRDKRSRDLLRGIR